MKTENRYSIALVFIKNSGTMTETLLRMLITSAVSNEEALGKGIAHFEEETKNFSLHLKAVIEIADPIPPQE